MGKWWFYIQYCKYFHKIGLFRAIIRLAKKGKIPELQVYLELFSQCVSLHEREEIGSIYYFDTVIYLIRKMYMKHITILRQILHLLFEHMYALVPENQVYYIWNLLFTRLQADIDLTSILVQYYPYPYEDYTCTHNICVCQGCMIYKRTYNPAHYKEYLDKLRKNVQSSSVNMLLNNCFVAIAARNWPAFTFMYHSLQDVKIINFVKHRFCTKVATLEMVQLYDLLQKHWDGARCIQRRWRRYKKKKSQQCIARICYSKGIAPSIAEIIGSYIN